MYQDLIEKIIQLDITKIWRMRAKKNQMQVE